MSFNIFRKIRFGSNKKIKDDTFDFGKQINYYHLYNYSSDHTSKPIPIQIYLQLLEANAIYKTYLSEKLVYQSIPCNKLFPEDIEYIVNIALSKKYPNLAIKISSRKYQLISDGELNQEEISSLVKLIENNQGKLSEIAFLMIDLPKKNYQKNYRKIDSDGFINIQESDL
jgi:hypothetical protein